MTMYKRLTAGLVVLGTFQALSACVVRGNGQLYGTTTTVVTPRPTVATSSTLTASVAVPTGVVALQAACNPGAPEQCNGLDDNCNGVIDEGCGYQTGNIQVTAAWNSSSDIDLHVVDPFNEEIYYGRRNSRSGGVLDRDANAACSVAPPTVENVYWSAAPPSGTYRIRVVAYDMCSSSNTPVTLSVAVGGRIVGAYQLNFTYDRQEFQIPFTIP
ncbi:MAG: hypothetical protein JNK72_07595 [Myxococcales bacterium]|nr:hypothetical protein [Myxococcales bacterium]